MLELLIQSRACPACGAGKPGARVDGASLEARVRGWLSGARRERSGLAYASGFAGVFYLFRYSLAPLAQPHAGALSELATWLFLLWSLSAPLAVALAFAAGIALDRSPGKSGVLPSLFGFFVGWYGIAAWLSLLDERLLWRLAAF